MGVLDKIKNALFEVEYVEVEDEPKKEHKEKKVKEKRFRENREEKPIAKKIVLPGKREEKIDHIEEEELKDEDFEIRPKDEKVKAREEFKFMDDNDFRMDDYQSEPEIVKVFDEEKEEQLETVEEEKEEEKIVDDEVSNYSNDYYNNYYSSKETYQTPHESKPYGLDDKYSVPVHEYGTYEKKEEKAYFRPSPIISPIYGILDKNYKKEDVKEKRDVRISSYSRTNVSVDDIRNKAYGRRIERGENNTLDEEENTKFEVEEDDNLLVDLSDRSKPEVKELTMGDAEEYFEDLGLEYNVDYVDTSTDKNKLQKSSAKHAKEEVVEDVVDEVIEDEVVEKKKETKKEVKKEVKEEVEELKEEEVKDVDQEIAEMLEEKKELVKDIISNDEAEEDDNLFDLIDSMYQENE